MRAPYHDETVVMVNTTRYGGCGGARAVYSAGSGSATEVAVHELGHSLGGLADEYGGNDSCGTYAGEVNTSLDDRRGAWPEWIDDLGDPREGGQYYNQCIYRPLDNCEMRSLNQPFCPVCNQHWALTYFGHPRVAPTAPVAGMTPGSPADATVGVPRTFTAETRLATGPSVTNEFEWLVQAPSDSEPQPVASGSPQYTHTFDEQGQHTLICRVIADTNFIKPYRYGANVDEAEWIVNVGALAPPGEVSAPSSNEPLLFASRDSLVWEDATELGAFTYNLYRGDTIDLPLNEFGSCHESGLELNGASDTGIPPAGTCWTYLVSGSNPAGEGTLGQRTGGLERLPGTACP
jgi:hypothetical protein